MSFNNEFVVGLVVGGILVDYIELRVRDLKRSKGTQNSPHKAQLHNPLTKLRKGKNEKN